MGIIFYMSLNCSIVNQFLAQPGNGPTIANKLLGLIKDQTRHNLMFLTSEERAPSELLFYMRLSFAIIFLTIDVKHKIIIIHFPFLSKSFKFSIFFNSYLFIVNGLNWNNAWDYNAVSGFYFFYERVSEHCWLPSPFVLPCCCSFFTKHNYFILVGLKRRTQRRELSPTMQTL
jgi:hypothetical protein